MDLRHTTRIRSVNHPQICQRRDSTCSEYKTYVGWMVLIRFPYMAVCLLVSSLKLRSLFFSRQHIHTKFSYGEGVTIYILSIPWDGQSFHTSRAAIHFTIFGLPLCDLLGSQTHNTHDIQFLFHCLGKTPTQLHPTTPKPVWGTEFSYSQLRKSIYWAPVSDFFEISVSQTFDSLFFVLGKYCWNICWWDIDE